MSSSLLRHKIASGRVTVVIKITLLLGFGLVLLWQGRDHHRHHFEEVPNYLRLPRDAEYGRAYWYKNEEVTERVSRKSLRSNWMIQETKPFLRMWIGLGLYLGPTSDTLAQELDL